jgi:hypothetical protein
MTKTLTSRAVHAFSFAVVSLGLAVVPVMAQGFVLDDFTSGSNDIVAKTTPAPTCKTLSTPTPLGWGRLTTLAVAQNPFGLFSETSIGSGHLIMDIGLNMYNRLDLIYGLDCVTGAAIPLTLNLGAYGRFRINFIGLNGTHGLNFNIVIYQSNGYVYSAGQNVAPQSGPFYIDFPFSSFVSNNSPQALDLSKVVLFDFVFQALDTFGVSSITAVR